MPENKPVVELYQLLAREMFAEARDLIETDPDVLETPFSSGESLLHWFAIESCTEIVSFLLRLGADPNSVDSAETPVLVSAVTAANAETVHLLLRAGALVDKDCPIDGRAIGVAAGRDDSPAILKLLIDAGASLDHCPKFFGSPLMSATSEGYAEIVNVLIDAGADPNLTDYSGQTALHKITAKTPGQIIETLISVGAHVNAVDDDGATPLQVAFHLALVEAAEILKKYGGKYSRDMR